jgi:hypothetical protein
MVYRVLADAVTLVHFAFVAFVVLGGILARGRLWVAMVHVPAAVWGVLIEFGGWSCPLTPLENWLRASSGGARYPGGFVEYDIEPVLYPAGLTQRMHIGLGMCALALNLIIYWRAFGRS